jgi:hypothetical protein
MIPLATPAILVAIFAFEVAWLPGTAQQDR